MRLIDLEVRSFGRVRSAKVEFGPGLNVFHGPNDLGKSTLVRAIRAALLLPFRAKDAGRYIPWAGGGTPYVNLAFEAPSGVQYRVSKKFGARAELQERPRGASWRHCARGREVDEKLREVLRWGIETSGRGGRGIPSSFLATVLLADQDEVEAVLRAADLQTDRDESGRQWLTDVLEASAMDPFFLKTLETVESHYSEAFTSTGRRARSLDAPLKRISDQVNAARQQLEELDQQSAKLQDVRETLQSKRDEAAALKVELENATQRLASLKARARDAETREALVEAAAEASAAFKKALFRQDDVAETERAAESARADVETVTAWVQKASQMLALQTETIASTQAAAAAAGRGPDEQEDTILRLQVERDLAALDDELTTLAANVASAHEYGRLVEAVQDAERQHERLTGDRRGAADALKGQLEAETAAMTERARLKHRLAATDLCGLDLSIDALKAKCDALADAAAQADHAEAEAKAELDGLASTVPDRTTLVALHTLHSDLREARAAVELGLALALQPEAAISVQLATDGNPPTDETVSAPTTWTALREFKLRVEGVGELHIQAGSEAKRALADQLAAQWEREGAPILARAGVDDLAALGERVEAQAQLRQGAEEQLMGAQRMRPGPNDVQEATAAWTAAQARRPGLEQAVAAAAQALTTTQSVDLSSSQEVERERREVEDRLRALEAELDELRAEIADLRADDSAAEASLAADAATLAQMRAALAEAPADLRLEWESIISGAEAQAEALTHRRALVAQRLTQTGSAQDQTPTDLDAALASARELEAEMRERAERLVQLQTELRDHHTRCDANLEHMRADGGASLVDARARLKAAQEALDAVPRVTAVSTPDLEEAEWDVGDLTEELAVLERDVHAYDLQLQSAAGGSAGDQRKELEERCERLEAQERALEQEYAGWGVLREVMLEVQEDLTSNLGSALLPQVQRRFNELATDPYTLSITSSLKTEGVMVAGQARDPNALSVGTRDQLATIYRLALAEQLGSVVVLDDQLVHSDAGRMQTLLSLLTRAARHIQIVVFTCRPDDYESSESVVRTTDLAPLVSSSVAQETAGGEAEPTP